MAELNDAHQKYLDIEARDYEIKKHEKDVIRMKEKRSMIETEYIILQTNIQLKEQKIRSERESIKEDAKKINTDVTTYAASATMINDALKKYL